MNDVKNGNPEAFVLGLQEMSNSQTSHNLIQSISNMTSMEEIDARLAFNFFIADERSKYFQFLKKQYHQLKNPKEIKPNFPSYSKETELNQKERQVLL